MYKSRESPNWWYSLFPRSSILPPPQKYKKKRMTYDNRLLPLPPHVRQRDVREFIVEKQHPILYIV